jgi:hypothetical protein
MTENQPGCLVLFHITLGGVRGGSNPVKRRVGLWVRDPGRPLRGRVRGPTGRHDGHGCLQRDAGVFAAHGAAVNQPAAIRLAVGCGDAGPAGL